MNRVEVVSVDLEKQCFHAIEFDSREKEILRKKLTRVTLLKHFANLDPCTVVMEACGGAHFLARELIKLGHTGGGARHSQTPDRLKQAKHASKTVLQKRG